MFTELILTPIIFVNIYIGSSVQYSIYDEKIEIPKAEAALILGASVYSNGNLSKILKDRTNAAIDLFEDKKIDKIIASGYKTDYYDESTAIKNYLLISEIPEDKIITDPNGINTFQSIYNAKNTYGINSIIIPTQKFHIERSTFIAKKLGLNVYGLSLPDEEYDKIEDFRDREIFAKIKAFLGAL